MSEVKDINQPAREPVIATRPNLAASFVLLSAKTTEKQGIIGSRHTLFSPQLKIRKAL